LDSGKSLNPNGIGLGLSICKSILVKIGCDITVVESTVKTATNKNHGTSIAFSLPVFFKEKDPNLVNSDESRLIESEELVDREVEELFFPKSTEESSSISREKKSRSGSRGGSSGSGRSSR
jgi:hypothetical protein